MQLYTSRVALAAIAIVGTLTGSALAETVFRDSRGNTTGRSFTDSQGTTSVYDARGNKLGSESPIGGGSVNVYDNRGNHVGTSTTTAPHGFDRPSR